MIIFMLEVIKSINVRYHWHYNYDDYAGAGTAWSLRKRYPRFEAGVG